MKQSKKGMKREVLTQIFKEVLASSDNKDFMPFDNQLVKDYAREIGFKNPFDVVKHDSPSTLPEEMLAEKYFIVHLGNIGGRRSGHAFVRGGKCGFSGFHAFEAIPQKSRVPWLFTESLVDRISESEAQTLSTLYNEGIVGDFFFGKKNERILAHMSRRARTSYTCEVCPDIEFHAKSLQLEVDAIFEIPEIRGERPPILATVEAKRTTETHFEVRQVYTAMRYLLDWTEKGTIPSNTEIHNLYVVRDSPDRKKVKPWYHIRIYDYYFDDPMLMSSIKLRKAAEYQLEPERHRTLLDY